METLAFIFLLGAVQLSTALKCYTGMVQNGKEFSGMKIKQVECAFGMNQCATVNYEVNIPSLKKFGLKLKATQAMCTTSVLNCQICSAIKKTLKMSSISKCDASCCNHNSCNNAVAKYVKNRQSVKPGESVMCYVGQFMKNPYAEKLNSNKITLSRCPGTTECVTVNYSMEISGISIQAAQGSCGSKLFDCDAVCDSMKRIVQNNSLLKCKAVCCKGDRCNKQLGQHYRYAK